MFDIGFSELLILGMLALIVLGPEKLPHAARVAGAWYARIRRTVASVQAEIEQEVNALEARQRLQQELDQIRAAEARLKSEMDSLQQLAHPQGRTIAERDQPLSADDTPSILPPAMAAAAASQLAAEKLAAPVSLVKPVDGASRTAVTAPAITTATAFYRCCPPRSSLGIPWHPHYQARLSGQATVRHVWTAGTA